MHNEQGVANTKNRFLYDPYKHLGVRQPSGALEAVGGRKRQRAGALQDLSAVRAVHGEGERFVKSATCQKCKAPEPARACKFQNRGQQRPAPGRVLVAEIFVAA